MKLGIYAMHDDASGIFLAPSFESSDDVAIRNFDFAMVKNEMMAFKPSDFSIYYLGEFDNETGVIDSANPRMLKRGSKRKETSKK